MVHAQLQTAKKKSFSPAAAYCWSCLFALHGTFCGLLKKWMTSKEITLLCCGCCILCDYKLCTAVTSRLICTTENCFQDRAL